MAENGGPSKADLLSAMRKLRSLPANRLCFDCGARNPSWATVTYGVFLCIDCSAVHRNLGVHLTFVRSTNLDVNWNWLQLRAMQVGGNANATQFFKQHGCNSTDAQVKYKSRAAQLYKDKLAALCVEAQRKYGNQVIIETHAIHDEKHDGEDDFFSQEFTVTASQSGTSLSSDAYISKEEPVVNDVSQEEGPRVDHLNSHATSTSAPVSVILKKPVRKTAGNKKGGLGAQKVKINFDDLEKRANEHEKATAEAAAASLSFKEEVVSDPNAHVQQISSMLAMQQIEDQKKAIEKKVAADPQKAAAVDRLGMGGFGRTRAAHSIGLRTIQQCDLNSRAPPPKKGDDDWEIVDDSFGMTKLGYNKDDDLFSTDYKNLPKVDDFFDNWQDNSKEESRYKPKPKAAAIVDTTPTTIDVQKKFGNAKAISSDMMFRTDEIDFETKAALSRFEGQKSLGSADLWGDGNNAATSSYGSQVPEMSDIKDSLRAGASKVAEKFSNLSSSLSSYMGERY